MTELTREEKVGPTALVSFPKPAMISEYCKSCKKKCNRKYEEEIYFCTSHSNKAPFTPDRKRKVGMKK